MNRTVVGIRINVLSTVSTEVSVAGPRLIQRHVALLFAAARTFAKGARWQFRRRATGAQEADSATFRLNYFTPSHSFISLGGQAVAEYAMELTADIACAAFEAA
jgi:hypothetical protein